MSPRQKSPPPLSSETLQAELNDLTRMKAEKVKLLETQVKLQEELPHLYRYKWYPWAREFFESTNRDSFLVAANQISKSSTQIRKCIEWATNKEMWPRLWNTEPRQFWYLYPTKEVATIEIQTKWVPEFLPRGSLKNSGRYGWKIEKDGRNIAAIHFNSGVSIYFKAYSQDESHLQSSTVHAIFCDEELPENLYDELNFRRSAVSGHFSMVFTATLGQTIWHDTMEEIGTEREKFKGSWKRTVSMYDCQIYEDGSPSHWSNEKIARAIASCKSEAEVQRRVYGRFVKDEGIKYGGFERKRNVIQAHPIDRNWHYYAGVDIGAGGDKNHPSSITIVAVNPEYKEARVIDGWQGKDRVTTMADVLDQFVVMGRGLSFTGLYYDYHAKDFGTLAQRAGIPFQPAEKSHEIGTQIVNVLFKNNMLKVFDTAVLEPLMRELMNVPIQGDKRKLKDDFADSLRYCLAKIPWNWEDIGQDIPLLIKDKIFEPFLSERDKSVLALRKKMASNQPNEISFDDELKELQEFFDI